MTGRLYLGDEYVRMLVTASRTWRLPLVIWEACATAHATARREGGILVIVHGDADGGDQIAKLYAEVHAGQGVVHEPHPADWNGPCRETCRTRPDGTSHRKLRKDGTEFCPAAGVNRNQDMVDLGARWALACIRNRSMGTSDCLCRIKRACIPYRDKYDNDTPQTGTRGEEARTA